MRIASNAIPEHQQAKKSEQRVYWTPCVPNDNMTSSLLLSDLKNDSRAESWLFPIGHLSMFLIADKCLHLKFPTHTVILETQNPALLVTDILSGKSDQFQIPQPLATAKGSAVDKIVVTQPSKEYLTEDLL